MERRRFLGMAAVALLIAGCDTEIKSSSVVNCTTGPKEGNISMQLPADTNVYIGNRRVKSLGNGRANIDMHYWENVIFGDDAATLRAPRESETLITGINSLKFRPTHTIFHALNPVHEIDVGPGEQGATKITATFTCDKLTQTDSTSQNK